MTIMDTIKARLRVAKKVLFNCPATPPVWSELGNTEGENNNKDNIKVNCARSLRLLRIMCEYKLARKSSVFLI